MTIYTTRAAREEKTLRRNLSTVETLAEIVGEPLRPLRPDEQIGLQARIDQEHQRLLSLQNQRDAVLQAKHQTTFAQQSDAENQAQIRAFWNE